MLEIIFVRGTGISDMLLLAQRAGSTRAQQVTIHLDDFSFPKRLNFQITQIHLHISKKGNSSPITRHIFHGRLRTNNITCMSLMLTYNYHDAKQQNTHTHTHTVSFFQLERSLTKL